MLLQGAQKLHRWRSVIFNVMFCSGRTVTAASSGDELKHDFTVLHTMLKILFNETDWVPSERNKREQPLAVTNGIQTEETCISGIRGRALVSISHVVMS